MGAYKFICKNCGKQVNPKYHNPNRERKYCDMKCFAEATARPSREKQKSIKVPRSIYKNDYMQIEFNSYLYGKKKYKLDLINSNFARISKYLYNAIVYNELKYINIVKNEELRASSQEICIGVQQQKKQKHHIYYKHPPKEIVSEMLEYGERKVCGRGYPYIEYLGYREYLHRLVVMHAGIEIKKGFGVHHIDHNKLNNNIENLVVLSWADHKRLHHYGNKGYKST